MFITEIATPCKEADPELWFAKPGTRTTRTARRLCFECPVRISCLESAVKYEQRLGHTQPGVYGGLDERERIAFLQLPIAVTPG